MSDEYIFPPPPTLPPGSAVIAYLRESGGPGQQDSLGQQLDVVKSFCKQYGLALTQIYAETKSGRKTKNRKEFLRMVDDVMRTPHELRPRGLLLWSTSRFARNVIQFSRNFYALLDEGLIIHSLTEQFPEGISGHLLLSIAAYTHEKYSIDLGKNIKRGIASRVREGFSNGGTPPKGYIAIRPDDQGARRDGKRRSGIKWIVDETLAPLVRLAWEMRAVGKGYTEITKATGGQLYTSKGSWITHFKNKSYLGIHRAAGEEVPDHHPALITWELWEAVRRVEKNRDNLYHYKRTLNPSLLAGLSFCAHCGSAMVIHNTGKYRSYICGKRDRQRGYQDCAESHRVHGRKAEGLILDAVLNRILSPEYVGELITEIESQMADTEAIDREIGKVNTLIINNGRAIYRLVQLAKTTGDIQEIADDLRDLKRNQAEYNARMQTLKAERNAATVRVTPEAVKAVFAELRSQIENAMDAGDVLTAKSIISQFVQRIELSRERIVIRYVYPLAIPAEALGDVRAHKHPLRGVF